MAFKQVVSEDLSNEEVLDKVEDGLKNLYKPVCLKKSRKRIHMLDRKEEIKYAKRRRKYGMKSKKYDGRVISGNHGVSIEKTRDVLADFYNSVKLPELKTALEFSNDPRYGTLLAMLNNPNFNNTSFPELCKKARMTLQDVISIWRSHVQNQGITRMVQHLPDIMEDVAIDSKSRWVICKDCQGEGKLYGREYNKIKDPICTTCNGDGKIRILGDKDARNLAFEVIGMRKTGGINVNVSNINNGGVKNLEDQIIELDKVFDVEYTEVKEIGDGNDNTGKERIQEDHAETDDDREAARLQAEQDGIYK